MTTTMTANTTRMIAAPLAELVPDTPSAVLYLSRLVSALFGAGSATVVQSVSVEWVQYQKVSCDEPVGTVTVWARLLLPDASGDGSSAPRNADVVPLWARVVLNEGLGLPAGVHGPIPFSKPGLMTTDPEADGVAGLEGAEVPPGPVGLDAATVKV